MATPAALTTGFYLSVPVCGETDPIIMPIHGALTIDAAREEAAWDIAMQAFMRAGYEDTETVFATLFGIAPNGGLLTSECFTIAGPEAE